MTGIYQRQRKNKYILPTAVYNHTIWQIRDYRRLKEALVILPPDDEAVDGIKRITDVIEAGINEVPAEYRRGVWDSIQERKRFPLDADRSTYGRYKAMFVRYVAERLNYV